VQFDDCAENACGRCFQAAESMMEHKKSCETSEFGCCEADDMRLNKPPSSLASDKQEWLDHVLKFAEKWEDFEQPCKNTNTFLKQIDEFQGIGQETFNLKPLELNINTVRKKNQFGTGFFTAIGFFYSLIEKKNFLFYG